MEFDAYQQSARQTVVYPHRGRNLCYPALGLCGEAGEVAETVKRVFRDDGGELVQARRDAISTELGDVLWYVALLADEVGVSLGAVARQNLDKLSRRDAAGTLHGQGDAR